MKIRLTESKLKQIVAESVKKILYEGKTVNNKPYFYSRGWGEKIPNGWGVEDFINQKWDEIWKEKGFQSWEDAKKTAMNPNDDRLSVEEYEKELENLRAATKKHNERVGKYRDTYDGQRTIRKPIYDRDAEVAAYKQRFNDMMYGNDYIEKDGKWVKGQDEDYEDYDDGYYCWSDKNYCKKHGRPWRGEKNLSSHNGDMINYSIPEEPNGYWDNLLRNARDAGRLW